MTSATQGRETLRLGTRSSALARWQADYVAARLRAAGQTVEIVLIETHGDTNQVGPISNIVDSPLGPNVGVFTKEIQKALLANEVDFAVHSLKDLPTTPIEGLFLAAVPKRATIGDALVSSVADTVEELPHQARVGTGSFRRRAQLLNRRPDLLVEDLRGNVGTRLRKLDDGEHDAILLAQAGLERLGLEDRITQRIPLEKMLPAPGQGALGIECRADDETTKSALTVLEDAPTRAAVTAERTALARLEGGCLAALGAWARLEGEQLKLSVVVLNESGDKRLDAAAVGELSDPAALGQQVADHLLAQGAKELLVRRG